jgi:hypothetical protein
LICRDKEKDEGKLLAQSLWNVTDVNDLNLDARLEATITEMIYVPDNVADGSYLLNLQLLLLKMMQVRVNLFCTVFNK